MEFLILVKSFFCFLNENYIFDLLVSVHAGEAVSSVGADRPLAAGQLDDGAGKSGPEETGLTIGNAGRSFVALKTFFLFHLKTLT